MNQVPEIDPEIRGLLEEIVANPRSSIRLVPRRALLSWFTSGETARARDISESTAVRHLVEAYREELAALLFEAGTISYWKAPVRMHCPVGPDKRPIDPAAQEPAWLNSIKRFAPFGPDDGAAELLRGCSGGVAPGQAGNLFKASLALVPRERTRCCLVLSLPREEPRTKLAFVSRLAEETQDRGLLAHVWNDLGWALCELGCFADARAAYRRSLQYDPASVGRIYAFTLSCVLRDTEGSLEEAVAMRQASLSSHQLQEAQVILQDWARSQAQNLFDGAGAIAREVAGSHPEFIGLCRVFMS
jgi:tetratricopeptide (TPR) repeat protein